MISYNLFPYFYPMVEISTLVGASASVLAIVVATAYREPLLQYAFLFGTIRLKYLALIVVLTDLLFITSNNAGGHIAHLGGALAGLWFLLPALAKVQILQPGLIKCWMAFLLCSIKRPGSVSPR